MQHSHCCPLLAFMFHARLQSHKRKSLIPSSRASAPLATSIDQSCLQSSCILVLAAHSLPRPKPRSTASPIALLEAAGNSMLGVAGADAHTTGPWIAFCILARHFSKIILCDIFPCIRGRRTHSLMLVANIFLPMWRLRIKLLEACHR